MPKNLSPDNPNQKPEKRSVNFIRKWLGKTAADGSGVADSTPSPVVPVEQPVDSVVTPEPTLPGVVPEMTTKQDVRDLNELYKPSFKPASLLSVIDLYGTKPDK